MDRDLAMGTAAFSMRPQCHMIRTPCRRAAGSLLHTSNGPNTNLVSSFVRRVATWAVQGPYKLVQLLRMHVCDEFMTPILPHG